jgi:hypothetical protein
MWRVTPDSVGGAHMEGTPADVFAAEIAKNERIVIQVSNGMNRRFDITGGAKVLDAMRKYCGKT